MQCLTGLKRYKNKTVRMCCESNDDDWCTCKKNSRTFCIYMKKSHLKRQKI